MMRRSSLLLVVVAFVAGYVGSINAEKTIQTQVHPSALEVPQSRSLKSTTDKDENLISADEDRAGLASIVARMKALLVRSPTKRGEAKNNVKGANEAIKKVNSIIGPGKTTTELTPAKVKQLETYARSNSDKWWAMAYYITNVLGIGLVVFFVYGTLFLGWRPIGMGGSPRPN
ncbi:hypothetical protein JG688_00012898 [Phytophthora aleatoria]|uniref:RxLR effector protein n=1 Tax=Phytophthora aleatoria TaxID=2496075 RepID=A0A8J5M1M5_9STRA|nr:hypothetical protein JG688_00012898 [Phytophthora aleatoria]